jgi:hypothetical protein
MAGHNTIIRQQLCLEVSNRTQQQLHLFAHTLGSLTVKCSHKTSTPTNTQQQISACQITPLLLLLLPVHCTDPRQLDSHLL